MYNDLVTSRKEPSMKRKNRYMSKYRRCPVCKHFVEKLPYEICSVCWWEADEIQEQYPDYSGGANKVSLNEARAGFRKGKTVLQLEYDKLNYQ